VLVPMCLLFLCAHNHGGSWAWWQGKWPHHPSLIVAF
jgi:hypothetical protein